MASIAVNILNPPLGEGPKQIWYLSKALLTQPEFWDQKDVKLPQNMQQNMCKFQTDYRFCINCQSEVQGPNCSEQFIQAFESDWQILHQDKAQQKQTK